MSSRASFPLGNSRNAATSHGCAEVGTRPSVNLRNIDEATPRERADQHPALIGSGREEVHQGGHRRLGLEVDVEPGVGEGVEQLGQRRHCLGAADQGARDLGVAELGDRAAQVGDPVEHGVVEGEQHTVAGGVDVRLEVAITQGDRVPERRHGVLEARDVGVMGAAAVRKGQHGPVLAEHLVEVRVAGARRGHRPSIA